MSVTGAAKTGPSAHVLSSIAAASRRTGISFDYLFNQARSESGFDPDAKAPTSSASGLYQFTRQTWLATVDAHGAEYGLEWAAGAIEHSPAGQFDVADPEARRAILDLRQDPAVAAAMAAEFASDNRAYLSDQLGRPTNSTDLALAHFLGAQGATRFLKSVVESPDASAAALFPEAAQANRAIFYDRNGAPRSFAQIHARFASMASDGNPVALPVSERVVRHEISRETRSSAWTTPEPGFEQMPNHLSLSFAEAAYRRLASMGAPE